MSERPVRRATTLRRCYEPGPDCRVCGYKEINVRHELDPEHAPEGIEYYRDNDLIGNLHQFEKVQP